MKSIGAGRSGSSEAGIGGRSCGSSGRAGLLTTDGGGGGGNGNSGGSGMLLVGVVNPALPPVADD